MHMHAFSSHQLAAPRSAALLRLEPIDRNENSPRKIGRRTIRAVALASTVALVAVFNPAMVFADKPATPVVVQGDVTVQGSVEVVNDAVNVPFFKSVFVTLDPGAIFRGISFDVPDGKRLVIEMIHVYVDAEHGQVFEGRLEVSTSSEAMLAPFPLKPTGLLRGNFERQVAFPPFKMRVDAVPGVSDEISVGVLRSGTANGADFRATICGYLVDL